MEGVLEWGLGVQWEDREKSGEDAERERGGLWEIGGTREEERVVLGMNRVRRCEFISLSRIPIVLTRGAAGQEQGAS